MTYEVRWTTECQGSAPKRERACFYSSQYRDHLKAAQAFAKEVDDLEDRNGVSLQDIGIYEMIADTWQSVPFIKIGWEFV